MEGAGIGFLVGAGVGLALGTAVVATGDAFPLTTTESIALPMISFGAIGAGVGLIGGVDKGSATVFEAVPAPLSPSTPPRPPGQ